MLDVIGFKGTAVTPYFWQIEIITTVFSIMLFPPVGLMSYTGSSAVLYSYFTTCCAVYIQCCLSSLVSVSDWSIHLSEQCSSGTCVTFYSVTLDHGPGCHFCLDNLRLAVVKNVQFNFDSFLVLNDSSVLPVRSPSVLKVISCRSDQSVVSPN